MGLETTQNAQVEHIYWLSEKTWIIATDPQVDAIRRYPRRFGLDDRIVIATYRHHGSVDGSAQEELVRLAIERGWVRVVQFGNPVTHFQVQCHNFRTQSPLIRDFLRRLVDEHADLAGASLQIRDTTEPRRPIFRGGAGGVNTFLVDGFPEYPPTSYRSRRR
jgi:hypothetical protein